MFYEYFIIIMFLKRFLWGSILLKFKVPLAFQIAFIERIKPPTNISFNEQSRSVQVHLIHGVHSGGAAVNEKAYSVVCVNTCSYNLINCYNISYGKTSVTIDKNLEPYIRYNLCIKTCERYYGTCSSPPVKEEILTELERR